MQREVASMDLRVVIVDGSLIDDDDSLIVNNSSLRVRWPGHRLVTDVVANFPLSDNPDIMKGDVLVKMAQCSNWAS